MFTKKQAKLVERIGTGELEGAGAPHLNELSEALTKAFGGVDALAEMLAGLANDPKRPDWLRTRAAGLVVNTIAASSKLAESAPAKEFYGANEAELKAVATLLLRDVLGITDAMQEDLRTVCAAWPELPHETRANIVDLVTSTSHEGSRNNELQR